MSCVSKPAWIATILLMATSTARAGGPPITDDLKQAARDRVDAGVCPGIVIGLVDKTGPTFFAYGQLAVDDTRPVDERTIFEIGSITKVFTAILLADAVEHGQVALDHPAQEYAPTGFSIPQHDDRQITLEHLATHRSGLPRMPTNFAPADGYNPYADYSADDLRSFLASCKLARAVGEKYEYSNLGAGLLGHILATRAGCSYVELAERTICRPLKMRDTGINLSDEQRQRLAGPHAGEQRSHHWDFDALAGCGALRSTAYDMLRFVAANMGLVKTELRPILERATTPRFNTGTPGLTIALGWHVWTRYDREIIWHNGQTGGFHSFCGFLKDRSLGVVVLANGSTNIDELGLHALNPRWPISAVRPAVAVAPAVLERYVGLYQLAPGVMFTITREEDRLYAQLTGQDRYRIYAASDTRFFYRAVEAEIEFELSGSGKVQRLVLYQNGRVLPAWRQE